MEYLKSINLKGIKIILILIVMAFTAAAQKKENFLIGSWKIVKRISTACWCRNNCGKKMIKRRIYGARCGVVQIRYGSFAIATSMFLLYHSVRISNISDYQIYTIPPLSH